MLRGISPSAPLTPKPWRRPFAVAWPPEMPAFFIVLLIIRHPVVREKFQSRRSSLGEAIDANWRMRTSALPDGKKESFHPIEPEIAHWFYLQFLRSYSTFLQFQITPMKTWQRTPVSNLVRHKSGIY